MIRWLRYDRNRKSAGFALVDIILGIAILSVALVGIAFAWRQSTVRVTIGRAGFGRATSEKPASRNVDSAPWKSSFDDVFVASASTG